MSIAYAFYVLRIVRVIYCVRDVSVMCQSVANGPLSQINLIWSVFSANKKRYTRFHYKCKQFYWCS